MCVLCNAHLTIIILQKLLIPSKLWLYYIKALGNNRKKPVKSLKTAWFISLIKSWSSSKLLWTSNISKVYHCEVASVYFVLLNSKGLKLHSRVTFDCLKLIFLWIDETKRWYCVQFAKKIWHQGSSTVVLDRWFVLFRRARYIRIYNLSICLWRSERSGVNVSVEGIRRKVLKALLGLFWFLCPLLPPVSHCCCWVVGISTYYVLPLLCCSQRNEKLRFIKKIFIPSTPIHFRTPHHWLLKDWRQYDSLVLICLNI